MDILFRKIYVLPSFPQEIVRNAKSFDILK